MDQRRNVSSQKKHALSFRWSAFSAVFLLFCLIMNNLSHHKTAYYTHKTLSLPKVLSPISKKNPTPEKEWTTITTRPGDTLSLIFQREKLSRQTLQAVLHNNPHARTLTHIKPNQSIQLLIRDHVLEKIIMPITQTQSLLISRQGKNYTSQISAQKTTTQTDYVTATVQGSLYNTAKRANIPYKLIRQMTDLFVWEVDFIKGIRAGDQFTILYQAYYVDNKLVDTGDILAVSYTNRGKKHQAIRHINASGDYDYFTPQGVSLKKAFSRYPIKFSHISSSYSLSRKHPLLHYNRPHKGVDLAASIGTPIYATGDGRVEIIDRENGYGNMIKITHSKAYASIYAHLLRFQKGLSRGDHVKRGQIIGYVGQTGLASGPHCHYEFHINQQPKNPTTVPLPHAAPIPAHSVASFKAKANQLLAQLDLYEATQLAKAGKQISRHKTA